MMNKTKQIIDHAEKRCKARGLRLTPKRKHVLLSLVQSEKALSAYELIDVCQRESGETLPAMSMYRILNFLQAEGLVHKLNLANKYVACAHMTCEHEQHAASQFLICSQCQKVEELTMNTATVTGLQQKAKDAGFHLLNPQLEMDGLCNQCMHDKSH